VHEVAARDLVPGDLVRLDDPQAHRVERVLIAADRVVLDLRPVGLAVSDVIRVTLPIRAVVDRLGTINE
jgi:hypothetical protein